jgi:uncharacterized Zn-finger protein
MSSEKQYIVASTRRQYQVTKQDLPLCCPMPDMRLWDAHPRVYLPITETGHAMCPYCDAEYFLQDFEGK